MLPEGTSLFEALTRRIIALLLRGAHSHLIHHSLFHLLLHVGRHKSLLLHLLLHHLLHLLLHRLLHRLLHWLLHHHLIGAIAPLRESIAISAVHLEAFSFVSTAGRSIHKVSFNSRLS